MAVTVTVPARTQRSPRVLSGHMGGAEPGETVTATGASHRAHCHDAVALKYMPLHIGWRRATGWTVRVTLPCL
jgi:hypothetical protein